MSSTTTPYVVNGFSTGSYQACVLVQGASAILSATYNVDLSLRRCSCGHYQQSGVPCYHALAFLKALNKSSGKNIVDDTFFHPVCLTVSWKLMANALHMFVVLIPNIAELLQSNVNASDRYFPHTISDNLSSMSGKRRRSAGDSAAGGGVTRSQDSRSRRSSCRHCGKVISSNTKHPPSACERFKHKHTPVNVNSATNVSSPERLLLNNK